MSIAGIASSLFSQVSSIQNNGQSAQSEFQQLAKDLQAGNLSAAQTDFAALQQNARSGQPSGSSSVQQAFSALGNDLQSGNLTGAQQDIANIEQDVQQAQQQGQVHHHHHHHAEEAQNSSANPASQNPLTQLFSTLGQDLQSGNLSSAQQAYASLQQDLQLFSTGGSSLSAAAPVSVTA